MSDKAAHPLFHSFALRFPKLARGSLNRLIITTGPCPSGLALVFDRVAQSGAIPFEMNIERQGDGQLIHLEMNPLDSQREHDLLRDLRAIAAVRSVVFAEQQVRRALSERLH